MYLHHHAGGDDDDDDDDDDDFKILKDNFDVGELRVYRER